MCVQLYIFAYVCVGERERKRERLFILPGCNKENKHRLELGGNESPAVQEYSPTFEEDAFCRRILTSLPLSSGVWKPLETWHFG